MLTMLTGIDMLICTVLFVMSLLTAIIAHLNGDDSPAHIPLLVTIAWMLLTALGYIMRICEVVEHAANP